MKIPLKGYAFISVILAAIILFSFLPRLRTSDAAWSSDETYWLFNSRDFMLSTLGADFSSTAESYHPGVTTMWLGGMSLWTKYKGALAAAPVLQQPSVFVPIKPCPGASNDCPRNSVQYRNRLPSVKEAIWIANCRLCRYLSGG